MREEMFRNLWGKWEDVKAVGVRVMTTFHLQIVWTCWAQVAAREQPTPSDRLVASSSDAAQVRAFTIPSYRVATCLVKRWRAQELLKGGNIHPTGYLYQMCALKKKKHVGYV